MKIAVLGGSFDPPHRGHVVIANRLLKLNYFDQIWLIPCYQHPFNKTLSSPRMRLEMTRFLERKKIKVSDFEIKRKTISYSIDTLRSLSKKYPGDNFCWIIGTDQVDSFTKWKNWKEIVSEFRLTIVPRTSWEKAKKKLEDIIKQITVPKNIISIDKKIFPPIYISSTAIRKKIKEKNSLANFVPKKVVKYIIENNLYTKSEIRILL
jgi:nicotinate-nucleotide adenylyltransferase